MTEPRSRLALAALFVCACLALSAAAGARPTLADTRSPAERAATVEAAVSAGVDGLREGRRLPRLRQHPGLARAAGAHSAEMVEHGFFSHASVDGTPAASRIAGYYPRLTGAWRVGEVLFWRHGPTSARQVIASWLSSPTHRARLLDPRFRNIGVSAVFSRAAPGAFGGRPVLVVTLVLGTR